MRYGGAQQGQGSTVFFSLYNNDLPTLNVELALYADEKAVIPTSRNPALRISYVESSLAEFQI
jgi:hypothetical protein